MLVGIFESGPLQFIPISHQMHLPINISNVYTYKNAICLYTIINTSTIATIFDRDRVVEFLARLNVYFDQVQVQILGKEKLPSLNEVFSIVHSEEYRRITMLNEIPFEGSAMVINKKDAT